MSVGIRVSKHTLRWMRLLLKPPPPSVLLLVSSTGLPFHFQARCKSAQLSQATLNVKHVKLQRGNCRTVDASSSEAHLEQAVFVAVLAQPHAASRREFHLRRVDHSLINPVKTKDKQTKKIGCEYLATPV